MNPWLEKHMPAPMAAPETAALRAARVRLIVALVALGAMTAFWPVIAGRVALGVFGGLAVFIAVQGIFWMRAKNTADDDYLMSRMTDDDGDGLP
ncbi:hypothetical protein [Novosphingobium sp. AP12]|uniref:hypothetical protein n=1 Tax=Novosphingobium sp. AP12 TaxID=1144305 RepID=UPI000271F67B|nr:hypothetical protein [Novosphingobium sp. AP12]EJL24258.1 hypothetical protein PMI02_03760 [Novosphingobium sp. AP12]